MYNIHLIAQLSLVFRIIIKDIELRIILILDENHESVLTLIKIVLLLFDFLMHFTFLYFWQLLP